MTQTQEGTHRRRSCEKTQGETELLCPMPRNTESYCKLRERRKNLSLETLQGSVSPADTLISYFWPLEQEENKFLLF